MNASDLRLFLAPYADGELDDARRAQVEAFLAENASAREEVQRWRNLRRCACRAWPVGAAPAGLRERVLQRLAHEGRGFHVPRRYLGFGTVLALAAVVAFLALIYDWPGTETTGPVVSNGVALAAADFARVHQHCACGRSRHDGFSVTGKAPGEARAVLAAHYGPNFPLCLPDFSAQGYQLAGACGCPPRKGMQSLHVVYVRADSGTAARPEDVISFFALPCRVGLSACDKRRAGCKQRAVPHEYSLARTPDNVNVVAWDESQGSVALVSAAGTDQLMSLADTAQFAVADAADAPRVAYAKHLAGPALLALGGSALAGLGAPLFWSLRRRRIA